MNKNEIKTSEKTDLKSAGKTNANSQIISSDSGQADRISQTIKSRTTHKVNNFQRIADLRAKIPRLICRSSDTPFAADLEDLQIDLMNRAEVTVRLEKQFCDELFALLEKFAAEHPQAKLRAGSFNA